MKEIPDDVALCLVGGNPIEEYNKIVTQENLKHIYFRDFMKMMNWSIIIKQQIFCFTN